MAIKTINDLNRKFTEIEQLATSERNKAIVEYCQNNNTIKIGDVVTDRLGSIKVEKVRAASMGLGVYECRYFGLELTKKGQPKKSNASRWVYQSNLKD